MASVRNRNGVWQARILRKGQPAVSKSFQTRQDAERWARHIETQIDKGSYTSVALAENTTLKELIERYIVEVTALSRSAKEDTFRLKALSRDPLAALNVTGLTPSQVAKYRDRRLKCVSNGTVIRELSYLSSIINHARREWSINAANPIPLVKKPPSPQGRNRLLSEAETVRLLDALKPRIKSSNIWMQSLVSFALESGMRRGEMLGLTWSNVNWDDHTAHIPLTKNGEPRTVPLSNAAINILRAMPRHISGKVFPINPPTVSASFDTARKRAGIVDFHFHDLRHMAITRMAEKLPNLIELSAVSGHKSLAMLKRYYHPVPAVLAQKLG
jgi:integrase